jgi:hypothetical protein
MKADLIQNYKHNFVDLLNVDLPSLVPAKLWDDFDKYRDDPKGMKRYLARNHKTKLEFEYDPRECRVSGEFDIETERISIFAVIARRWEDREWDYYKFEVIVTLMHEYIHYMQWLKSGDEMELVLFHKESKNPDKQEDREYYAGWSEIQAYGHCIYMEMKAKNANKSCAEMLQSKRRSWYSPSLRQFRAAFDGFDYPLRYLYREVLRWEKRYESLNIG